jgi:hypothetical protein
MNYQDYKECYSSKVIFGDPKIRKVTKVFLKADEIVNEKDMIVFYPKNVFLDDKQFELFLFCTNKCIVNVKIDDDEQYFIIRYIKIDDIYKKSN